MICRSCQTDSLAIAMCVDRRGIPPGEDGHDIAYSHAVILSCGTCRGSELEIHTHDCFDPDDLFDEYDWFLLGPAETAKLLVLIDSCPDPLSAECACPVHDALRTSCRSLPSSAGVGGRGSEADFRVHRAYLEVNDGVPRLATGPKEAR